MFLTMRRKIRTFQQKIVIFTAFPTTLPHAIQRSDMVTMQYNLYSLRLQTCNNKRSDASMQKSGDKTVLYTCYTTYKQKRKQKQDLYTYQRAKAANFRIAKRLRAETTQAETTQAETTQGRNDSGPKRLWAETTRYPG